MRGKVSEMIGPENPLELEVGTLRALADAFLPDMNLSGPADPPDRPESETNLGYALTQARYRMLIDQLPAATFMAWLENGHCELYVSSYVETLLGYTATEWAENPILWYQRLHPEDRERWNEEFSRTVASAEHFRGDYRFLARDGRIVWIHGEVKVMYDESGRPFMHGIGYDITDLKNTEEDMRQARDKEQRANRAKSEFLSRTSHELRTPLNSIMGFAEFLIEGKPGPLNPKQKEYLQDIYNSGQHLLQLINDVLDLAKVEAGKMGLAPEKFSVRTVVESVCAGARPIARKHSIRLDVDVSPELMEVTLDQQKLKQILYNLLSNAIKFTEEGGVVKIRVEPESAQHFKLVVKDTGIGIKSEDLPRLFQDFEQLESGSSRRYEGSGLGLALTKRLVELQSGTISVESEYGVGTTFSVVLPKRITEGGVHAGGIVPRNPGTL
jgi:PAS domain S-box-containing protein